MRLKGYGLGEVSDRLSILALKRLYGAQARKDVSHFTTEYAALLNEIHSQKLNVSWVGNVLELAAINAALWHAEDDLRQLRQVPVIGLEARSAAGDLAFRIQDLNDQRAALIERINKVTGEHAGPEKL